MKKFVFFILLTVFTTSLMGQILIYGDTVASEQSVKHYYVKTLLGKAQWKIEPSACGTILRMEGDTGVAVQWTGQLTGEKRSETCHLTALIKYPNIDYPKSFSTNVRIKKNGNNRKSLNNRLSLFSKDSVRIFYKIVCDTHLLSRSVVFVDSSVTRMQALANKWILTNSKTNLNHLEGGKEFKSSLTPGHYTLTLLKKTDKSSYQVRDTFTLFARPVPSFTLSNQIVCAGNTVTFTNKSINSALALSSLLHFGDGISAIIPYPETTIHYVYNKSVAPFVLMSRLELRDLYECSISSKEIALSIQENKFTQHNSMLQPQKDVLQTENDSVILRYTDGNSFSLPNPNGPFTYLWNTGQKTRDITIRDEGEYELLVTDDLGCHNENKLAVSITKQKNRAIRLTGPKRVRAGNKMKFSMEAEKNCYYQWRFFYNNQEPFTTKPDRRSTLIPNGWQNSKPGILYVIGIRLEKKSGKINCSFSDTLRVDIVAE